MFYLWRRGKPVFFLVIPLLFMLAMPAWALLSTLPQWLDAEQKNWPLIIIGSFTLILEAWMIVEGLILLPGVRGVLERSAAENRVESKTT
jgi:carbon starvation protein